MRDMKGKSREELEERIRQLEASRLYWMREYKDVSLRLGDASSYASKLEIELDELLRREESDGRREESDGRD